MHTTHTTDTDGQLDRFTERWRKQATNTPPSKRDKQLLARLDKFKYSLQCGRLYLFDTEQSIEVRCGEEAYKDVAKLASYGLLELRHGGRIRPNEEGMAMLENFNKLQKQ